MVTLLDWGLKAGVWHPPSASGVTYLFPLGARKSLGKEGGERRSVSEEDQASLLLRLCGRRGCVAEPSCGQPSGKQRSLPALKEAACADPVGHLLCWAPVRRPLPLQSGVCEWGWLPALSACREVVFFLSCQVTRPSGEESQATRPSVGLGVPGVGPALTGLHPSPNNPFPLQPAVGLLFIHSTTCPSVLSSALYKCAPHGPQPAVSPLMCSLTGLFSHHGPYFAVYNAPLRFWPKFSGEKTFCFNF